MFSKNRYIVDNDNKLASYFCDEERKIPDAHLKTVCLIHQKSKTCRYISLCPMGYVCMKKSPVKIILDQRVKNGEASACGDNCEGLGR